MDYIILKQRENKKAIKESLSEISLIEFRDVPNPEGDTGDSVIFFFSNRDETRKFMKLWTEKGFGTKNLPDAINWHFAGTWDHILYHYDHYAEKNLLQIFSRSDELMRTAIALPVFVNMQLPQIETIVDAVHDCVNKM